MSPCFADTFYFLALVNPRDEAHGLARQFADSLRRRVITTQWVLTEFADGLAETPGRPLFRLVMDKLEADPRALIVPASDTLFRRGARLYDQRKDKDWSLTDCISFEVMRDYGLTDVLTGDHHFEQAGFVALLK